MEALSQAGTGSVTINVTASVVPGIPIDFIDIVGLDGIKEKMTVVVQGIHDGAALPK